MKANRTVGIRLLALFVSLVLGAAPALAQNAPANEKAAATTSAATAAKAQTAEKPPGGPQEGIKVHGHWVIEVRNPDGSLVTHKEFENSLQDGGKILLLNLLTRQATPGTWSIAVSDGLCPPVLSSTVCQIVENASGVTPTGSLFTNLKVSPSVPTSSVTPITLSGSLTASSAGSVSNVILQIGSCPGSTAPQSCTVTAASSIPVITSLNSFTSHPLAAPVSVQQGQIVQFTVTISFS